MKYFRVTVAFMIFLSSQCYGVGMYFEKSISLTSPSSKVFSSHQKEELSGRKGFNPTLRKFEKRVVREDSVNQNKKEERGEKRRERSEKFKTTLQIVFSGLGFLSTLGYYFYLDAVAREVVFRTVPESSRGFNIFLGSFLFFILSLGTYAISYVLFAQRGEKEPFLVYLFNTFTGSLLLYILYILFQRIALVILRDFLIGIALFLPILLPLSALAVLILKGNIIRTNSWLKLILREGS